MKTRASRLVALVDKGPTVPAVQVEGFDEIQREISAGHPLWLDIQDATPEETERIQKLFSFHPLAIEDVHHAIQRPKIEEYDDQIFLVAFGVRIDEGTRFTPLEVDIFLGARYLVSFHEEPVAALDLVAERCMRGRVPLEKGADRLLRELLDGLVDSYSPLLEAFDDEMEKIEQRLPGVPGERLLREIFATRRRLLDLRRLLIPQRDLLGHLVVREYRWISTEERTYFRDIYDHLVRFTEAVDRIHELLDTAVEIYLGQAAYGTNRVMKILAVIATMGLPLTVTTGFFGMNFRHLPGLGRPEAIGLLIGALVVIEVALVVVFRRKGWL